MPEAVIVDAVRSPIGRAFKGSLAQLRPDETAAYVVDQLLERNPDVAPDSIEDVFCGCGMPQGLQAFNIARIIVLLSEKLPQTVNGVTFSRYCASRLDAIRRRQDSPFASAARHPVGMVLPTPAEILCSRKIRPSSRALPM